MERIIHSVISQLLKRSFHNKFYTNGLPENLKNRFLICNHDLLGPDITYFPLLLLSRDFSTPINIVYLKGSLDHEMLSQTFHPYMNFISTENSVDKIIAALQRQECVLMFVSYAQKKKFLSSTSTSVIMSKTNCTVQLLTMDLDKDIDYLKENHQILSTFMKTLLKFKNDVFNSPSDKKAFYLSMANSALTYSKILSNKQITFYVKCSKPMTRYSDVLENRHILFETNLNGHTQIYQNFKPFVLKPKIIRHTIYRHNKVLKSYKP